MFSLFVCDNKTCKNFYGWICRRKERTIIGVPNNVEHAIDMKEGTEKRSSIFESSLLPS